MFPRHDETPTSRAASGGLTGQTGGPSEPDYITPTSDVPTAEQWSQMDAHNERALLWCLMHCRYADVLHFCEDQDPRALYAEPRRVALRALVTVSRREVEDGHGDDTVAHHSVNAEVMDYDGPEMLEALAEIRRTTPYGANTWTIPDLWQAVKRARLFRALDSAGRDLIGTAETRDPSRFAESLRRLEHLPRLAAAADLGVDGDDERRTA
ncbi:hypothetical protein BJF89_16180 [Corynebacterium sp. CNJ-954]|nr:hypothetical protein BJF89_16180 [Corynebacterium sp. CNJ-954]